MAQLKASIRTYTNGRPVQQHRLGEDQAEATLTSRSGTAATGKLFADGSGFLIVRRGGKDYTIRWSADDAERPSDIEIHANFDGVEGALAPVETVDARD